MKLDKLYELQKIDIELSRLEKQKDNLPARAELAAAEEKINKLEPLIARQKEAKRRLRREQKELEESLRLKGEKIKREEGRLYSGAVANPKELKSLQAEVAGLKKQVDEGENLLLSLIEKAEKTEADLAKLRAAESEFKARKESAAETYKTAAAEIDTELTVKSARRREAAAVIEPELLKLYDDLRAKKRGVAVAVFKNGVCDGCRLKLSEAEAAALNTQEIKRCPHCRRLLIET